MHVLIIGLGETGKLLAANLLAQGHQVTGVSRHAQHIEGVRHLVQDVLQADYASLPPINWVYILLTPDQRSAEAYQRIFIESILSISKALAAHPIQKIVFISSTSVYGQQHGEWVDEDSPTQPTSLTAQILLQAEQRWRDIWQQRLIVVRPSGIYSATRQRLIRWVLEAKPVHKNQWTNRIHIDDLAGLLAQLIHCKTPSMLFIATDQQPALQDEVLDGIARFMGQPLPAKIEAACSGKRLKSKKVDEIDYVFRYASWQQGYLNSAPRS
jgi:nucleoside-diphosphate-sugar epimerase